MEIADTFNEYSVIATGGGEKLERWGGVILLRPDPQAIWKPAFDFKKYKGLNAYYKRSGEGGGAWETLKPFPAEWLMTWQETGLPALKFKVKPMGFKHTGLFPEQSRNWSKMMRLIKNAGRPINVLNLFAYTGGATAACLSAGASVCHVDASKGMTERAGENVRLSGAPQENLRLIVDDCFKFVGREIKRGKKYDAVIMDPPSYGRGPNGEMWKLENDLFDFVKLCTEVLSDKPLFFLINSYTTGLQPAVIMNMLNITMRGYNGTTDAYELCLPTEEENIVLPCGCSGLWTADAGKR